MREAVVLFYRNLYSQQEEWRPRAERLPISVIDKETSRWVDSPFDREQVLGASYDLDDDQAPGLDGFTMAFCKHCWGNLEKDIMLVFRDFILFADWRSH